MVSHLREFSRIFQHVPAGIHVHDNAGDKIEQVFELRIAVKILRPAERAVPAGYREAELIFVGTLFFQRADQFLVGIERHGERLDAGTHRGQEGRIRWSRRSR